MEETHDEHVVSIAAKMGLDIDYVERILLPDDPRDMSEDEKRLRGEIINNLYNIPLSLAQVGASCGGLTKERIRQIMTQYDFITRPLPGSKRWRDVKKARQIQQTQVQA